MRLSPLFKLVLALLCQTLVAQAKYILKEDFFDDAGFFSHFMFIDYDDPTGGTVQYVNKATAEQQGLIRSTSNSAWLGADSTNILAAEEKRKSIRLHSYNDYTHMLLIVQFNSIPVGCGSWPAFWTVGRVWPTRGEIDIIEGVHNQAANRMSLHTTAGCATNGSGNGILNPTSGNADCGSGCSFDSADPASYSRTTAMGGGVWAMEWNSDGISIWHWETDKLGNSNVLTDSPDVSTFGIPQMNVPAGPNCDVDAHFMSNNVLLNWDFCGTWAGDQSEWDKSGCKSAEFPTCPDYVRGNPRAFEGMGWDVRYMKVFVEG